MVFAVTDDSDVDDTWVHNVFLARISKQKYFQFY